MVGSIAADRCGLWSRYWATGAPHSCGGSYGQTYGGTVAEFWRPAWEALAPGDSVLDIATGNAALPRLLLAARPEVDIGCDAVDLAQIAPPWLQGLDPVQRRRLRVHGGVAAEALPFADGSFALVTSQYGIEYADLTLAIPELLRVLAPGGRVRIVAHHAGSQPALLARHEIEHVDWLMRQGSLFDAAAAMIKPMARAATAEGRAALAGDADAQMRRQRYNDVQSALDARQETGMGADVLHEVREGVARVLHVARTDGAAAAAPALERMRVSLGDARQRLADLCRHALDEAGVRQLGVALARPGLRISAVPLSDRGHLLGWAVSGDPPAAATG